MIKLIVGLGNPGQKYSKTRHNAGFLFLDALAKKTGAVFSKQVKFHGELAEINQQGNKLYLLKPTTFMNRSGTAVAALMKFYKILPEEILVVHDELDFDVGIMRLKLSGGHGGHNGLRDIIANIVDKNFARLRVGIGRPKHADYNVADYVLSDFSKDDRALIEALYDDFIGYWSLWFSEGYESVVQKLHSA